MKDYYAVLGVTPEAEDAAVQGAYRGLMKKYHPDVFVGNPAVASAKTIEINEAYAAIGDPASRARYDAERDAAATTSQHQQQTTTDGPGSTYEAELEPELPVPTSKRGSILPSLFFVPLALAVMWSSVHALMQRASGNSSPAVSDESVATSVAASDAPADSASTLSAQEPSAQSEAQSDATSAAEDDSAPAPVAGSEPTEGRDASTTQLSAVTPDNQPTLHDSIMHALDTGTSTHWQTLDGAFFGFVLVSQTRQEGDQICRNYRYTVRQAQRTWLSPDAIACRREGQLWGLASR